MTATMYYDNDADPAALAGQTVAIVGYGIKELVRTGAVVMLRGAGSIEEQLKWEGPVR